MDSSRIKKGAVAGAIAGMAMGMWMMFYYLAAGLGFWSPLGYIGHFVLRNANITEPAQVVAGLVIHMMTSMFLGAAIAAVFRPTHRLPGAVRGMALALGVWVVMQYGVLNILDQVAYEGLVQWAFAVGHGIFGGMLGLIVGTSLQKVRGVVAHAGS